MVLDLRNIFFLSTAIAALAFFIPNIHQKPAKPDKAKTESRLTIVANSGSIDNIKIENGVRRNDQVQKNHNVYMEAMEHSGANTETYRVHTVE